MSEKLMLGNEAIARGAWEAGVNVVSSYPGTPSTEITECVAEYDEVYTEWATNEKVALEVCCGASVAGARAMCCMKHVGVNVAADPLFTAAYTGVNGGLLIVCADDPGMHSSQNEQDSRFYARSAHVAMLEPSDSRECRDFAKLAFEISEKFDTPVMLRITTRIAHSRSMVDMKDRVEVPIKEYKKDAAKYVMMPAMAKPRHIAVEKRMEELSQYVEECPVNRMTIKDGAIGVICSGISYQYVREALPEASILKLGVVYPLPRKLIENFASKVERLVVIEELEPFMEDIIAAWGIPVEGVNLTGLQGELSVNKVKAAFGKELPEILTPSPIPGRPPVMCAGCPHRGPFSVLSRLGYHVTGDIGCYTLGALKPLCALDTTLCMGASIGMAQGFFHARGEQFAQKTVAVIGDSTFLHSGVTSLISAVYNQSNITVIILDNTITGMTGHQPNPNTGREIHGNPAPKIDLDALCRGCGVERVKTVDSFDLKGLEAILKEETAYNGVSVIIARRPCALLDKKRTAKPYRVDGDKCVGCGRCMKLSCPAISRVGRKVKIDPNQCVGCSLCFDTCSVGAIERTGDDK
ncbi:MAG: indolepyruvate ferredoxin oxidoreductase subunit alpha [Clostridia bacterium]|nr:indolepyruvate ferredoxin oxidoreductase subunit alpha [Clostridia bacterium]